jgi:hypothetical protein
VFQFKKILTLLHEEGKTPNQFGIATVDSCPLFPSSGENFKSLMNTGWRKLAQNWRIALLF